ncbi:1556_t:CDS:2 [Funneliformis mosseae]|uniref:1556_t:CDS:1 n=1 Tax=Funneliformis mosseae TaxID=27381 RepID=A0A9N9BUQ8_FUNMO|nr:1556_t:CDS:2 [Funneliformis mosseae]
MSSIIELSDIDEYNAKDFAKKVIPKVIYTTVPVEYPDTFLEGVATIYNVTGWENPMDAFLDINKEL